ncbi:MAG: hypothetical protein V7L13_10415, partial [Nostoc sp.]|uniref:hypothetical protein n=1 Tax=Nostoc sp. TaxID=1180 RepID=UPI002FF83C49
QINQTRELSDTRPLLLMAGDEGRFGRIGEVRSICILVPHRIKNGYRITDVTNRLENTKVLATSSYPQ